MAASVFQGFGTIVCIDIFSSNSANRKCLCSNVCCFCKIANLLLFSKRERRRRRNGARRSAKWFRLNFWALLHSAFSKR
eukprot:g70411.t1